MRVYCLVALMVAAVAAMQVSAAEGVVDANGDEVKPVPAAAADAVAKAALETPPPQPLHEHPTLRRMLIKNNAIRARLGLAPHRISPELTKAAQDHANYMASRHNFDHYANGGPNGRANRHGFQGGGVRENIARGQGDVEGAFAIWQGSGAHYASIVSHTTDAGFGLAVASNGTPYWVAVYGNGPAPRVEVLKPATGAE